MESRCSETISASSEQKFEATRAIRNAFLQKGSLFVFDDLGVNGNQIAHCKFCNTIVKV